MERRFIYAYRPYIQRHNYPKVRCSFWMLAWSNGCLYDCSYCWLKAYHPWSWTEVHIAEKTSLARVLERFCSRQSGSQILNTGELCDSFVAPEYISFMASTLRHYNEEYGCSHRLLLLTKSADPQVLLENSLQDVVVYSVSVNTETNAKDLEHGAPSPMKRIHAAQRLREVGYEVRIRVDPIIINHESFGPDSQATYKQFDNSIPNHNTSAYVGLLERICAFIEPSLITLGTLRATPRTYHFLPPAIRAQLTERTHWGYGYPSQTRISIYEGLADVASSYGVPVALCKESLDVWRQLGLKGPCNCMSKKET